MKIGIVGKIKMDSKGRFKCRYVDPRGELLFRFSESRCDLPESFSPDHNEPSLVYNGEDQAYGCIVYALHWSLVMVRDSLLKADDEELILRIKHVVLKEEQSLSRISRQVKAFENMERVSGAQRERIPESVRLFVWQRDEGKCVSCGSREMLEYDHIIPVAHGGSNTDRNIQLLCQTCNRKKGKNI